MFVLSLSLTRHRLASLPSRRCGWRVPGQIVCGTWWWYTPAGGKTQRRTSCWESTSPTRTGEKEAGAGPGCTCAVLLYTLFPLLPAKAVRSAWCCLCGATQRSIWMVMGEFRQCSRPPVACTESTQSRCPMWCPGNDQQLSLHHRGFTVNTAGRTHVFKPVSVQVMW